MFTWPGTSCSERSRVPSSCSHLHVGSFRRACSATSKRRPGCEDEYAPSRSSQKVTPRSGPAVAVKAPTAVLRWRPSPSVPVAGRSGTDPTAVQCDMDACTVSPRPGAATS
eukprot:scaffold82519_cov37-Phaeocystis_antarctica.AAC.2